MTHFAFATCRVGVEAVLKDEAAKRGLRPAFMRPGFVSFKRDRPLGPDWLFDSVFAHAFAASYARTTPSELPQHAHALAESSGARRVHLYPRALVSDDDRPSELSGLAASLDLGVSLPRGEAQPGEVVLDVVLVDPEVVVLGAHLHSPAHSPFPGGLPPLVLPVQAPSRAWLKLEEALLWHPQKPRPGESAIEIGSAPGGTAYGLIERGLRVFAVDPAEMDERLLARTLPNGEPALVHVRKPAAYLGKADIDTAARWLLIDINDNPEATLKQAEKTIAMLERPPALILTLKLADWTLAAKLDSFRKRIEAIGYDAVRPRQLAHGRREVVLLA